MTDPSSQLTIRTKATDPRRSLVWLTGEVDHSNHARLEAALRPIAELRPGVLIIDCAELTFIDSSGLAALMSAWNLAEGATRIELQSPSATLRRMVEVTGLTKHLVLID